MTKLYPYLIKLGLLALALVIAYAAGHQRAATRFKTTQATQVVTVVKEAAVAASDARAELSKQQAKRAVQAAKEKEKIDEAVQANPDWSHLPVPDSVWEALGGE